MLLAIEWARAFPSSRGFNAGAWEQERSRSRSSKRHASKPNAVAMLAAASFMLCSPAISAFDAADAAVVSQLAELAPPGRQEGAALVSLPASWDLYGRMQRVERTMFTKADAMEMRAEIKADANEMRAEMKADAKEMRAEMKAEAFELRVETVLLLGLTIFYSNGRMDKQRSEDIARMEEQRSEDNARMVKMEARAATKDVLTLSVAFAALIVAAVTPFAPQLISALTNKST